jgi:chemotaxis protein MotB
MAFKKGSQQQSTDQQQHRRSSKGASSRRGSGGAHLGTWKLVYADFVTVLMAFFIIIWVLLWDKVSKIPEQDTKCIEELSQNLRDQISADKNLSRGGIPIEIELLHDGLRLTLLDNNQPMFERGQAVLSDFAKSQFEKIASAINLCPTNRIVIEGYTDANPFSGGLSGYSNWELSADRANAARRELVRQEVSDTRIARITGYAGSVPSLPDDPFNALNRRISITVLPNEIIAASDSAAQSEQK